MSRGQFRVAPWQVVFDGQSLNGTPATPYPAQVMAGRGIPYRGAWIAGLAWAQLDNSMTTRFHPYADSAEQTLLVMCGGTTDIAVGVTGFDLYVTESAYAVAARGAGFNFVIATTLPPSTGFTVGQEAERVAHNVYLLADIDGSFDAVVDLTVDSRLEDPTDTTYYTDGTHWTYAGAAVVAEIMDPVLDSILT